MEAILAFLGIVVVWALFNLALRAGVGTVRAAARTAMGKGSFTDNFQAAVVGMGPLEARITDTKLTDEPGALPLKEIQVKGLIPVNRRRRLAFVTSVFDKTSGELEPVISALDIFQEPSTTAFQHTNELGSIEPGIGLVGWVRAGVVIPEIIETPFGGKRQLVAILRLVDLDNRPGIERGFHDADHPGLLWQRSLPFEYVKTEKGYIEAAELRDNARLRSVQIGMAIAMWNGSLGEQEGETIKKWIQKILRQGSDAAQERLKSNFNQAMKEAYTRAQRGELSLTELTEQLNDIDDTLSKYETVELCFEILASSSIESSDKARVIDLVAKALKLDPKEIERLRDLKIVGFRTDVSGQMQVEDLLGIDQRWDTEQIKRHLRTEFQKWNNRLTTLPEGDDRENAQRMLDTIAAARKKYG